jgi:hypothetical protein
MEAGQTKGGAAMNETVEVVESGRVLHIKVTGTLSKEDYKTFTPLMDKAAREQGKVRLLFEMHDFHGWTPGAAWEDAKLGFKHWNDIERIGMVGDSRWEQGMAAFAKPFTRAKVKYFDSTKLEDAKRWIAAE